MDRIEAVITASVSLISERNLRRLSAVVGPDGARVLDNFRTRLTEDKQIRPRRGPYKVPQGPFGPVPTLDVIRFDYSVSVGVNPSRGNVVCAFDADENEVARMLEETAELILSVTCFEWKGKQRSERVFQFCRLRLCDFRLTKKGKTVELSFEDPRWWLKIGGVWGEFNIIDDLVDPKELKLFFKPHSLKPDRGKLRPWKYLELIEGILSSEVFTPRWPRKKCPFKIEIAPETKRKSELAGGYDIRLVPVFPRSAKLPYPWERIPLNKRWRGASRTQALESLLRECGLTLAPKPEGSIEIVPALGKIDDAFDDLQDIVKFLSLKRTVHRTEVPERLIVVGSRKHYVHLLKWQDDAAMKQAVQAIKDACDRVKTAASTVPNSATLTSEFKRLMRRFKNRSDLRVLQPVIHDLSGNPRDLFELFKDWFGVAWWLVLTKFLKVIEQGEEKEIRADLLELVEKYWSPTEADKKALEKGVLRGLKPGYWLWACVTEHILRDLCRAFRLPDAVEIKFRWEPDERALAKELGIELEDSRPVPRDRLLPLKSFSTVSILEKATEEEGKFSLTDLGLDAFSTLERKVPLLVGVPAFFRSLTDDQWLNWALSQSPIQTGLRIKTTVSRVLVSGNQNTWIDLPIRFLMPSVDGKHGVVRFRSVPLFGLGSRGTNEHFWAIPFVVPFVVVFAFELKEPDFGPLNHFVYELDRPDWVKHFQPNAVRFVSINDLVEYRSWDGTSNREQLIKLLEKFRDQIWLSVAAEQEKKGAAVELGVLRRVRLGCGITSYKISGSATGAFSMQIEASTGRAAGDLLLPLRVFARALAGEEGPHFWTLDEQMQAEREQYSWLQDSFARGETTHPSRRVWNWSHGGILPIHDPADSGEDVLFASASVDDSEVHVHHLENIGPLLAREPVGTIVNGPLVFAGHVWHTPNIDRAGCGHKHQITGVFWYPYVRAPASVAEGGNVTYVGRTGQSDVSFPEPVELSTGSNQGLVVLSFPYSSSKYGLRVDFQTRQKMSEAPKLLIEYLMPFDSGENAVAYLTLQATLIKQDGAISGATAASTTVSLPETDKPARVYVDLPISDIPDNSFLMVDLIRDISTNGDTYADALYLINVKFVWFGESE